MRAWPAKLELFEMRQNRYKIGYSESENNIHIFLNNAFL